MEIRYKKFTEKELDTFIQMRIQQLREEGANEDVDGFWICEKRKLYAV